MEDKKRLAGRRGARYGAVQAVYSALMTQADAKQAWLEAQGWDHLGSANHEMLKGLIFGALEAMSGLDDKLAAHMDRPLDQLDPMEHAVLLVGAYELAESPELSRKIVINEAVELSKMFGADQAHKYVNGVLDKLSRELRPHEHA